MSSSDDENNQEVADVLTSLHPPHPLTTTSLSNQSRPSATGPSATGFSGTQQPAMSYIGRVPGVSESKIRNNGTRASRAYTSAPESDEFAAAEAKLRFQGEELRRFRHRRKQRRAQSVMVRRRAMSEPLPVSLDERRYKANKMWSSVLGMAKSALQAKQAYAASAAAVARAAIATDSKSQSSVRARQLWQKAFRYSMLVSKMQQNTKLFQHGRMRGRSRVKSRVRSRAPVSGTYCSRYHCCLFGVGWSKHLFCLLDDGNHHSCLLTFLLVLCMCVFVLLLYRVVLLD
jgi:hypothetical protein